ncbi:MAG: hypothetical protein WD768_12160 [Phycisphaeraceae bacterium]
MNTEKIRYSSRLGAYCFLAITLLPALVAVSAPEAPAIAGAYDVTVKGSFTGKGTIAIGSGSVTIILQVKNSAGSTGQLMAANLTLDNGRFSGVGTVLGTRMTVSGRIDAADPKGPVRAATLQATFSTDADEGGRIVGIRRGGGK